MELIRKRSRQREAILACLQATDLHPSAEWIYRQVKKEIPNLSLGTVYRNLAFFTETGKAKSLGAIDGQERFDGDVSAHPHFICKRCGTVLDWPVEAEKMLPEAEESARSLGVRITETEIRFSGLCAECLKEQA